MILPKPKALHFVQESALEAVRQQQEVNTPSGVRQAQKALDALLLSNCEPTPLLYEEVLKCCEKQAHG